MMIRMKPSRTRKKILWQRSQTSFLGADQKKQGCPG
jgi:hypothetical protein